MTLDLFPDVDASPLDSLRAVSGVLRVMVDERESPEPLPTFRALELVGGLYFYRLRLAGPLPLPRLKAIQSRSRFDLARGGLSIVSCDGLGDMTAFGAIDRLDFLSLKENPDLTSLAGLSALRELGRLELVGTGLSDLRGLEQVSGLHTLELTTNPSLESVQAPGEGRELSRLVLADNDQLTRL